MARLPLPRDYILASLMYIDNRLEQLPNCSLINHNDVQKIVSYNPRHEYKVTSVKGKKLMSLFGERRKLEELRRALIKKWSDSYSDKIDLNSVIICGHGNVLGDDIWNELKEDTNSYQKQDSLYHNGIKMRSRGEMFVGEILDQLGLDYLYEPEMIIDGRSVCPDFVVRVPVFGCCFIVEYMGCLDEYGYLDKNKSKIGMYFHSGIFLGTNLVILCADRNSAPSLDTIHNSIVSLLANLCSIYLKVS